MLSNVEAPVITLKHALGLKLSAFYTHFPVAITLEEEHLNLELPNLVQSSVSNRAYFTSHNAEILFNTTRRLHEDRSSAELSDYAPIIHSNIQKNIENNRHEADCETLR